MVGFIAFVVILYLAEDIPYEHYNRITFYFIVKGLSPLAEMLRGVSNVKEGKVYLLGEYSIKNRLVNLFLKTLRVN